MSDLLSIGASGLKAYQSALGAVGENVANAQTPGYARRRVVLEESNVVGSGDLAYRAQLTFNGVTAVGVARAWDEFKATEARFATSAAGRSGAREQWLSTVETALDDGPAGVGASMTGFFTAVTSLASDPGSTLGRRAVLTQLDATAAAFRRNADSLARISDGIGSAASLEVTALNDALRALDNLNGALAPAAPNGAARASLEDQRDRLIDFIAGKIDVNVSIGTDGRASLTSGANPSLSLLGGNGPSLVTLAAASDGRLALNLSTNGTIVPLPASGGTLAGLVEVSTSVADRRAALDSLATDFAATVNAWSAAGRDSAGNPGQPLLSATAGAGSIQAVVSDPALVPAADAAGAANGNLLALDAIRTSSRMEERWTSLVSANAQMLNSARAEASAAGKWRDTSLAALDEVTGVDLDSEAADMLRYQQAYNASARIIQVARETIQALFDAL